MSRDAGTSRQTAVGTSLIMNSVQCNAIQYKLLMMCLTGTWINKIIKITNK